MLNKFFISILILLISGIFLSACKNNSIVNPTPGAAPDFVFTQSNQSGGNNVIQYNRGSDGNLTAAGTFSTQGSGTGTDLGTQGSLALDAALKYLYVVNAGSNDITSFSTGTGLTFINKISSGGTMPASLTVNGSLLYVLNAGGAGNISGFRIGTDGSLTAIPNSTRNLSNGGTGNAQGPAEISFNSGGSMIVVTEKTSNKILAYTVNSDGTVNGPNVNAAVGSTPFGFAFKNDNQIVVAEAYQDIPDSSAVVSYGIAGGITALVSGPVFTTQTSACWVVITTSGSYTYSSNTNSGTITGFSLNGAGQLALLNTNGITASIGSGTKPADIALTRDSNFMYVLNIGSHNISCLKVNGDGSLTQVNLNTVSGLSAGTAGIVAK